MVVFVQKTNILSFLFLLPPCSNLEILFVYILILMRYRNLKIITFISRYTKYNIYFMGLGSMAREPTYDEYVKNII